MNASPALAHAEPAATRGARRHHARLTLGIVALAIVLALSGWEFSLLLPDEGKIDWVGIAFIWLGPVFVAAGVLALARRPANRVGTLLTLVGLAMVLPALTVTDIPLLWTTGHVLNSVHRVLLVYLVLTFPRGRLETRWQRAVLVLAVVDVVGFGPVIAPFSHPEKFGCFGCGTDTNLVFVGSHPELFTRLGDTFAVVELAMFVAFVVVLAHQLAGATRPARRVLAPVYAPAAAWSIASMLQASAVFVEGIPFSRVQVVQLVTLSVLPLTFLVGLLRAPAKRSRVGELVIELGRIRLPENLRAAVGRSLRDPSVEIGFYDPESRRYVTAEGQDIDLPHDGDDDRVATLLEQKGRPLAAIVHDSVLKEEPELVEAVAAAARLAVENERLHAELRAQLAEVRASRTRIVAASDAERRRLERNIHDGAQQRLVALSLELRMLRDELASDGDPERLAMVMQAERELASALAELRDLANGLHPAILTDQGLSAALTDLAERAPLPVEVAAPETRFPPHVEATAYFVASESLTNVVKYASASRAEMRVRRSDGRLTIEVIDDGIGGADPRKGTGLRGLADRVAALDGELSVDSAPDHGTRVMAQIPCVS